MAVKNKKRVAVVAGDVMIDRNLSVDRDKIVAVRSWADAGIVRSEEPLGGAWLLEGLIRSFASATKWERGMKWSIHGVDDNGLAPPIHQTYTVVTRASDDVLRVHEFLGVQEIKHTPRRVPDKHDDPRAGLVVLLDSDLGFDEARDSWPRAIVEDGCDPWVILKTSVPDFSEALWRHLIAKHAERLVVILTVEDLRHKGMHLIRRVSWERTAQDLLGGISKSATLQALRQCKYLIVSFGTEGAMLFPRGGDARLVFDPASMEKEWAPEKKPTGSMIGYTTILAAAVAHEVMLHPGDWPPQFADALPRGIAGMRALFEKGFGENAENPKVDLDAIARAALDGKKKIVSEVVVREPAHKSWMILEDRLNRAARNRPDGKIEDALYELAARVAVFGPEEALADVPQLSIGDLFTVDREEIESYRSIKGLLTEYVERAPSQPLSVAVFGSPGSGKSFGVKEIVNAIRGAKKIRSLTFNLTQFASASDLRGAFHQVRDVSLRGEIPLVFWDEFDTTYGDKPLGWLRYFISPMQDGHFQEDQITHPIGTSIFVFAGGTATSKDAFVAPGPTEERKALKVPDFISRLKGFLDVTGPNRREGQADPFYLIRRATVLRSMFWRNCRDLFRKEVRNKGKKNEKTIQVLQIAPDVLHAFLNTKYYLHGARSLESLIAMSALAGRKRFVSSSLPPEPQLALHVELPFRRLADSKFALNVELLERQARLAHEAFVNTKKNGTPPWTYNEVRDDDKRQHNLLVDYDELPENEKEANRSTVRFIPTKVAKLGLAIAPAGSAEKHSLTVDEINRLAEHEHEIWMDRKKQAGYVWGPKPTESPKRSPYVVPWAELEEEFREVDRAMIRAIPAILGLGGYILVKKTP